MASSSNAEKEHLDSIKPVVLNTLFGIRPTVYVPMIWLALLVILVSIILGLPTSIISPGMRVHIQSTPPGAAVLINNTYRGASPYIEVLPKGTYTITVSLPAFTTHEETITTKNIRILRGTAYRTKQIQATLTLKDPEAFVRQNTEELASWSMAGRNKLKYFIPDTLSTALAVLNSLREPHQTTTASPALSRIQTTQHTLVRNALPYMNVIPNKDDKPSFAFSFMPKELAKDLAVRAYLELVQTPEKSLNTVSLSGTSVYRDTKASTSAFSVKALRFLHVPRTTLQYGIQTTKTSSGKTRLFLETQEALKLATDNAQTTKAFLVTVPSFYIMSGEVTQTQYQRFLQETSWDGKANISPDHTSAYLKDFDPYANTEMPMRFISYYDAHAFAQWFDAHVAPLGYHAIIPNEYQWHAAALQYRQETYILGLTNEREVLARAYATHGKKPNFLGGVWEFTSSWYAPLPQFADFNGPQYGSEKVILGGSYINKNAITQTRGIRQNIVRSRNTSMSPSWVSAYLGFRIALIPRQ